MSKAVCLALAAMVWVVLAAVCVREFVPPIPRVMHLTVRPGAAPAEPFEPLIATGRTGAGDLLYLHRTTQAWYIGCDHWGYPPPEASRPVPVPPDGILHLEIEMPSAYAPHGVYGSELPVLRVIANGQVAVEQRFAPYQRAAEDIWFGENAIGAGGAAKSFSGEIRDAAGLTLRGTPAEFLSLSDRIAGWLRWRWDQVLAITTLAFLAFIAAARSRALWASAARDGREHRVAIVAIGLATVLFAMALNLGSVGFFEPDMFNVFFDSQTESLRHGRLDVPLEAIRGEVFVYGGKYYGYFGIAPSLLRLPLLVLVGQGSSFAATMMLLEFAGGLVGAYFLLLEAAQSVGRTRVSSAATAIFLVAVGVGSALFYLGVRPMFFHEAVLTGAVFAIWSSAFTLRFLRTGDARWWWLAMLCAAMAANGRPTTGMYALLLAAGATWFVPLTFTRRILLCGAAFVGLFSANVVSYLKFHTFDGSPLQYATSYPEERRRVIDGRKFHLENIPFCAYSYFVRPNFHLTRSAPFLRMQSNRPPREFPKAKIDVVDEVLGPTYSMPFLLGFGVVGSVWCAFWVRRSRVPLLLIWAAGFPMYVVLLAFISVAMRYCGDMCPPLIAATAIVMAALDGATSAWRRRGLALAGMLAAVSALVTVALVIDYQGRWGQNMPGPVRERYRHLLPGIAGDQ